MKIVENHLNAFEDNFWWCFIYVESN